MKLKTQTLILTYLLTTFFVSSQWIQTNGPQGGKLQEIVEVNNVLILSAEDGGLYRSDDDGNSWRAINAGFPCNVSIRSLISDNGLVYVLTKENGIFKSEDLGTNWESINNNIADLTFNAIYANGSNLYAANEDGGVFFSPSAGTNWVEKSTGVAMELFEGFANFNGGIYAAGNSLYSTLDNGDTWNPISLPSLISGGIKFISATANTLFITDDNAVFFSTGNLASWTAATVNTGAPIVSLETFGNRIYLTTSEGRIFFSDNEGVSWGQIQNTTTNRFAEHALFSNSKIFMSTSEGLFSSTTNGQTWVENNNGIKAVNITSMHAEGATVYVGTESQHIFRSDDNGQSWTRLRNGLISIASSHVSDIIAYNGALLIATDDGVYQSNDNGNNWVKILNPSPGNHVGALTTRDQILVAAVSGEGVYRSFDDGQTWSLLNGAGLGINTEYESAVILNSTILVTASNGRIYETTDLGLNWGEVSITNGFTLAYKLLLHEDNLYAATARGLWISTNGGASWNSFNNDESIRLFDAEIANGLVYVASDQGIFIASLDNSPWFELCGGMGERIVNELVIKEEILLSGTRTSSVWEYNLEGLSFPPAEESSNILENVALCSSDSPIDLSSLLPNTIELGGVWSPNLASTSNILNPSVDVSGVYTYTLPESSCGCSGSFQIEVEIDPSTSAGEDVVIEACINNAPFDLFERLGENAAPNGLWNPPLASGTNIFDPTIDAAGIYNYIVSFDCGTDSAEANISISGGFEIPINLVDTKTSSQDGSITVSVDYENSFEFSLDEISFSPEAVLTVSEGGTYTIYGRELNGCGFFQKEVSLLVIPKFFSPNNDAVNDIWEITGNIDQQYTLQIFDRFGKFLKQLNSANPNWDGVFRGRIMPKSDYWFRLVFENGRSESGHFSLIR